MILLSVAALEHEMIAHRTCGKKRFDDVVHLLMRREVIIVSLTFEYAVCWAFIAAGFLTSAAKRGASIFKMMDQSRHGSVETLRGYVRDAEIFKEHAGMGLL